MALCVHASREVVCRTDPLSAILYCAIIKMEAGSGLGWRLVETLIGVEMELMGVTIVAKS